MQFVDLKRQHESIEQDLRSRLQRVVADAKFILGPEVAELEHRLADIAGVVHCIGVANGTDAIQLCLRALGIGTGDAVFVPSFTFVATAEVASQVGATPVFVDVHEDTFNMDATSLERAISRVQATSQLEPRAIIAVDLFGLPADYAALHKVAEKYGLQLIEDAAQSFGSHIGDEKACSFARLATTSFFPAKPLGCYGDGGAVFTSDDEMADLLRSLRVHGKGTNKYDNVRVGLNSRLDTMQAAVLLAKLDVFDKELERRNSIASFYNSALETVVQTPVTPAGYGSSWAQYTITTRPGERDRLKDFLASRNIPSVVYYPKPLHLQPVYESPEAAASDCPVSTDLASRVLSIPVHPYLTDDECAEIVSQVREFYGRNEA